MRQIHDAKPSGVTLKFARSRTDHSCCLFCVGEDIQGEAEKTGLVLVGRGRILDFKTDEFKAGEPHAIDVEVDRRLLRIYFSLSC